MARRPKANPAKKEKTVIEEGRCHKCNAWVAVESVKDIDPKVPELFWCVQLAAAAVPSFIFFILGGSMQRLVIRARELQVKAVFIFKTTSFRKLLLWSRISMLDEFRLTSPLAMVLTMLSPCSHAPRTLSTDIICRVSLTCSFAMFSILLCPEFHAPRALPAGTMYPLLKYNAAALRLHSEFHSRRDSWCSIATRQGRIRPNNTILDKQLDTSPDLSL
jgi:hypothetical protein